MYKIFFLTIISVLFQQATNPVSPDGKFKLTIEAKEESDLQTRYMIKLTEILSNETIEIANCIRRDLPAPNYYWDKESEYLIFELCDESFENNRIKILNLKTKKSDFELQGIIGNRDSGDQFDIQNGILFYFDTSTGDRSKIPDLWTFNLKTKKKERLFEFNTTFNLEFPEIKRAFEKREITLRYQDNVSGLMSQKIEY